MEVCLLGVAGGHGLPERAKTFHIHIPFAYVVMPCYHSSPTKIRTQFSSLTMDRVFERVGAYQDESCQT
jgi:hypothetical protein